MDHYRDLTEETVERALTRPQERRILSVCIRKGRPVRDIAEETGLPLASTYRHVNRLVEDGVLVVERSALTADGKAYDIYRSRVKAARLELTPDAVHVSWDVNEPLEDRLMSIWERLRD